MSLAPSLIEKHPVKRTFKYYLKEIMVSFSPFLLVSVLGWGALTIILNSLVALFSFFGLEFNIFDYVDTMTRYLLVTNILISIATVLIQWKFIQKYRSFTNFFQYHYLHFFKTNNGIADPEALMALGTATGRLIKTNIERLGRSNIPNVKNYYWRHWVMFVVLLVTGLISLISSKFELWLGVQGSGQVPDPSDIIHGSIIIDLDLLIIPISITLWLMLLFEYWQLKTITRWYSELFNDYKEYSKKFFILNKKRYTLEEELKSKREILNYFKVGDEMELISSITNFDKNHEGLKNV